MFKDFLNSKLTGAVLNEGTGLKAAPASQASYVEFGYGQVEPNHLSAQRTAQIYAQLPANPEIEILEQGQFVKYDYAANENGIGEVNFEGKGEWMLVYNEIKLYRNHLDGSKQWDCEFAMLKDDYQARIYTPYDWETPELEYHNGMYLNGKDSLGNTSMELERYFVAENPTRDEATGATVFQSIIVNDVRYMITDNKFEIDGEEYEIDPATGQTLTPIKVTYEFDDVTRDTEDYLEWNYTNDPWKRLGVYREKKMRKGTSMVPRVFKTNVGDIFTTNTINVEEPEIGMILTPGAKGILEEGDGDMQWQVVKIYTMPDGQKGVKLMRIA